MRLYSGSLVMVCPSENPHHDQFEQQMEDARAKSWARGVKKYKSCPNMKFCCIALKNRSNYRIKVHYFILQT